MHPSTCPPVPNYKLELNYLFLPHTAQKACSSFLKEQRSRSACKTPGQNLEILFYNNGNTLGLCGLTHTDRITRMTLLPLLNYEQVAIYTWAWPAETQACKEVSPAEVG